MHDIRYFQKKVEAGIKSLKFDKSPPELYDPVKYILSLGGKRMRPVLTLMACEMFGGKPDDVLKPAIGIELFHNFTLVHDDIMDNAPLRRTLPTVHSRWNTNIAILSGDLMYALSYSLVAAAPPGVLHRVLSVFNRAAVQVCEGQQLDMNYEKKAKVSIMEYLRMIELKTAALLAASLEIGAITGGSGETDAKHLREFGKSIGIAFQIRDDILDVYASERVFGKQKGGDILSGKKTYLLLKAMELAPSRPLLKKELDRWLSAPSPDPHKKVKGVTAVYDATGVRSLAEKEMNRHYVNALRALEKIGISEEKKEPLRNIAVEIIDREK